MQHAYDPPFHLQSVRRKELETLHITVKSNDKSSIYHIMKFCKEKRRRKVSSFNMAKVCWYLQSWNFIVLWH